MNHSPQPMNANNSDDRAIARRLLAEYGLALGDKVLMEEYTRRDYRRYVGEVIFATVSTDGTIRVTYSGRSGYAAGGGSAILRGERGPWGARVLRKLTREDNALLAKGGHWSHVNTPLNAHEWLDAA